MILYKKQSNMLCFACFGNYNLCLLNASEFCTCTCSIVFTFTFKKIFLSKKLSLKSKHFFDNK